MKKENEKEPKANVVSEAYDEIMNEKSKSETKKEVTDCDIKKQDELLNPDPNSLDSRG